MFTDYSNSQEGLLNLVGIVHGRLLTGSDGEVPDD